MANELTTVISSVYQSQTDTTMTPTTLLAPSDLMQKLTKEKKIANEFQFRRHIDWNDNYQLYRNKIKTNRLTQRQAVNIPLMKETIKTLISKIDEAPMIDWKELAGDEMKELLIQELWNEDYDRLNLEGVDIQDKKTVLLYGRSFKKLNWSDEGITVTPLDIFDVVIDPLTDPLDIEMARFVIHQNIFRSFRDILADDRYDSSAKDKLKTYFGTKEGIIQGERNREEYLQKIERLKAMGVYDRDFPLFAAGEAVVNLTEHFTKIWDSSKKEFVKHVVVYADDIIVLMDKTLDELLGIDFYPFVTWTEDIETNDFWSDGPGDLVRTPNKILNIWFSQLVENRTLRNFQMHWYDASIQGYTPQTYEPGPGRMLPAPGDPNKVIMPVEVQGLDETMNAIDFLIKIVERSTAATAIEKGTSERQNITLGEVQILVGKAQERALAMVKFYRRAWQELAMKWLALMTANHSKKTLLHKVGGDGKLWPKTVYPGDWKSKVGFKAIVRSSSEQDDEKTKGIQRFVFIRSQFPTNAALNRIAQKRMLELVDLTPEELREVEADQKQVEQQTAGMPAQPTMMPGQASQPLSPGTNPLSPLPIGTLPTPNNPGAV